MSNSDVYAKIRKMKKYAVDNNVPIMLDDGIDFLTNFVIKNHIENVLEIGTAIGYSSIMMALANPNLKIKTVERDEERYMEALKNVKEFDLEDRITLIFNDANDVSVDGKYDLIFIDAAKGQNINFFEKFEKNLDKKGYIVTDNIEFHGLVKKSDLEIKSRNLRGLVRKIRDYIRFLKENKMYETEFYEIGDGIAVSKRK